MLSRKQKLESLESAYYSKLVNEEHVPSDKGEALLNKERVHLEGILDKHQGNLQSALEETQNLAHEDAELLKTNEMDIQKTGGEIEKRNEQEIRQKGLEMEP